MYDIRNDSEYETSSRTESDKKGLLRISRREGIG
jgi:hypothetical protein